MSNSIINLSSLIDLSNQFNGSNDEEFILNSMLLSLMGKLRITKASVFDCVDGMFELICSKPNIHLFRIKEIEIKEFRYLNATNDNELPLLENGFLYIFPLISNKVLLAIVCIGSKIGSEKFSEDEIEYINLVSNISSTALQNTRNFQKLLKSKQILKERNQLLTSTFEMVHDFSFLLKSDQILKMLSLNLMGQLMVSKFAVYTINEVEEFSELINRIGIQIDHKTLLEFSKISFVQKIEDFDLSDNKLLIDNGIKIIAPMNVQGVNKGLLIICNKMNNIEFTDFNLQFIQSLANTAISALENERLLNKEVEKKRLERELEYAFEIQKNLLPKESPKIPEYSIFGLSNPSQQVGGDYFDYVKLDDENYLFVIADVSGKGMAAALIMANFQAALCVLAPLKLSLEEIVVRLNEIIYSNTTYDKFVTCFFGILNIKSNKFNYINAGHNPPILLRDSGIKELTEGGIILGILSEKQDYDEGEFVFSKNDILLMYTDGITESLNQHYKEFGEENLKQLIIENRNLDAEKLSNLITENVKYYAHGTTQYDDITLIAIKKI